MKDLDYNSISVVLELWDEAKFESKDFEGTFGISALTKLIEIQPKAKHALGFDKGEEQGREFLASHGRNLPTLFDAVFQSLGPDTEFIEEMLKNVAARHKNAGVKVSFFPYMGDALVFSLEHVLAKPLTEEQRAAWDIVYGSLSDEISRNILHGDD